MALYSKRFSTVEVETAGLYNEKGEPVPSVETDKMTIRAGDRVIVLHVNRGGTKMGEFGKGSGVEIEVLDRSGIQTKTLFKVDL